MVAASLAQVVAAADGCHESKKFSNLQADAGRLPPCAGMQSWTGKHRRRRFTKAMSYACTFILIAYRGITNVLA